MANGFPLLNIVLFNTDSSDEGILAPDRYRCMDVILDSVLAENRPNLFILANDKINGPKHRKLCQKLHQHHALVRLIEEAGVYYDTETNAHYDVEYVDVGTLQQVDDDLGLDAGNVFTVSRLTACVLTPTEDIEMGKILLVSWHGPWTTARSLPPRQACFQRLVRFLERLKDQNGCDMVIVGGDFNFPAGKACEELDKLEINGEVSASYTPTEDRSDCDLIDYVVYWPKECLHVTEYSVVKPDFRREKGTRPFDHNILLYRFDEIDSYLDLAQQFRNMSVYENEE